MTTQSFNLDIIPQGVAPQVYVSQYDKGQTWLISLFVDNLPFNIPSGASVTIQGSKPDSTGFQYACTFADNVVTATEEQQMTAVAGKVPCEIVVSLGGAKIASLNFCLNVEPAALRDDTQISETDLPLIEEAAELAQHVGEVKGYMEMAEAYAAGTINGEAVPSTNPAYENNAKYYAEHFIGYVTDSQYTAISNLLS